VGRNHRPVDPAKVVKIEAIDLPTEYGPGHGYYELRRAHEPDNYEAHDVMSLDRVLKKLIPERAADILDRLQNFRLAYINLATGEITS
jgi:hypothetical protein